MIRFLLWGLPVLLLGGGVTGFVLSRPSDSTTVPDPSTAEIVRLREAEDDALLQVYQDVISRTLQEGGGNNLAQDRAQQLQIAAYFLEGFTQRYTDDLRSKQQVQLIVAHRQLGLTRLLLRDYARSEAALRDSLRLAEGSLVYKQPAELQTLQALNEGSLGWVLAMTGRLAEAEDVTKSAIAKWAGLIRSIPDRGSLKTGLAVYQRNLAMIREAGGADGLANALASVESAATAVAKSMPTLTQAVGSEASVLQFDTLIDSEQILGMLYWQHGRPAEAEAACRSSITRLQEMLAAIKSTYEVNRYVATTARSERYRDALGRALANLDLLDRHRGSTRDDVAESDSWDWKLLHFLPGEILPIDFLIRGNRFPGEFEPQDALLLSWQYEWAEEAMTAIISAVHAALPVVLIVDNPAQQRAAERHLGDAGVALDRIQFLHRATESLWVRDFGPLCVRSASRTPLWIDPVYPFTIGLRRFGDDELPQVLAQPHQMTTVTLPYLIEGGGILTNGAGICLVSNYLKDRNAALGMGDAQLTAAIRQYLGAEQVVYLDPLIDEPTRHVDWFCAFTSPETIVVGEYGKADRPNRDLLDRHARRLSHLDTPGGKLNVIRIPMPPRAADYFGGSYTNVIFANGVLIVPTWPEASADVERQVLELYQQLLPDWTIVPVPSRRFGFRGGGPHCCSMNLLLRQPPPGWSEPDRGT